MPSEAVPDLQAVEAGGGRVLYSRRGSGSPLVMLHGSTGHTWLPLHAELARSFDVVALALPGWSGSDCPEWARDVRDLGAVLRQTLAKLGVRGRFAVLGHGMGAWVAAELAVMTGEVDRLVLVAPAGLLPEEGEFLDQFLVSSTEYVSSGFAEEGAFERAFGSAPDVDQLERWEINREMTSRVAWSPYMYSQSLPHLLPGLDIPALVVWGSGDRIVPGSVAERYARLIPGAKLEVIDGAGHFVGRERPAEVAALVTAFLARD
jgi:pimeloyl-ACP methyl ester carboxylesterase